MCEASVPDVAFEYDDDRVGFLVCKLGGRGDPSWCLCDGERCCSCSLVSHFCGYSWGVEGADVVRDTLKHKSCPSALRVDSFGVDAMLVAMLISIEIIAPV